MHEGVHFHIVLLRADAHDAFAQGARPRARAPQARKQGRQIEIQIQKFRTYHERILRLNHFFRAPHDSFAMAALFDDEVRKQRIIAQQRASIAKIKAQNPERFRAKRQAANVRHRAKHGDSINAKRREPCVCSHCGANLRKGNISIHMKTNKCKEFVA
jgi:hypothetical protein